MTRADRWAGWLVLGGLLLIILSAVLLLRSTLPAVAALAALAGVVLVIYGQVTRGRPARGPRR